MCVLCVALLGTTLSAYLCLFILDVSLCPIQSFFLILDSLPPQLCLVLGLLTLRLACNLFAALTFHRLSLAPSRYYTYVQMAVAEPWILESVWDVTCEFYCCVRLFIDMRCGGV